MIPAIERGSRFQKAVTLLMWPQKCTQDIIYSLFTPIPIHLTQIFFSLIYKFFAHLHFLLTMLSDLYTGKHAGLTENEKIVLEI